jgi:hypothetical protein
MVLNYITPLGAHFSPSPCNFHVRQVSDLWTYRTLGQLTSRASSGERGQVLTEVCDKTVSISENGMSSFSAVLGCGCLGDRKMREAIVEGSKMSMLQTTGVGGTRGTMKR